MQRTWVDDSRGALIVVVGHLPLIVDLRVLDDGDYSRLDGERDETPRVCYPCTKDQRYHGWGGGVSHHVDVGQEHPTATITLEPELRQDLAGVLALCHACKVRVPTIADDLAA